jgi:hypothetical protein
LDPESYFIKTFFGGGVQKCITDAAGDRIDNGACVTQRVTPD